MIAEITQRCSQLTDGRDLLIIQDTTSFNLNQHYYRLKADTGMGPIEDNFNIGFFLHASLVLDAFSDILLGIGDIQLWHRKYDDPNRAAKIRSLPIEQKESYKWIRGCNYIKSKFANANSLTFVEDRDGDIYEQFATVPDAQTHLVIRCCKDRKLSDGTKFFDTLGNTGVAGKYSIELSADPRSKRKSRTALLEVRFTKVFLARPQDHPNKNLPEKIQMYAVEAREKNHRGKDKICWKLLTTHSVNHFDDALAVIGIYRKRWYIEQLFRVLKKQGFAIEDSQLESGWALRKLCILGLNTMVRVMQLMMTNGKEDQPASQLFNQNEQQCLTHLNTQYEGKTTKQKNPFKPNSLLWAKWIIARIGGWKSYSSQRAAGPITLKRGLDTFNQIYIGWCLALKVFEEDVGTQ